MGLLGLYIPLLVNITPLDADQFTRVARCFISVGFFRSMPGNDQETITRQDLTEFLLSSLLSLKRLPPMLRVRYLSLNNSKSRVNSNLLILETKGTISSTLKSWITLTAFRKQFMLKIQRKRPNFWTILLNSSRNAIGRSELLILLKPVGLRLNITRVTLLLLS